MVLQAFPAVISDISRRYGVLPPRVTRENGTLRSPHADLSVFISASRVAPKRISRIHRYESRRSRTGQADKHACAFRDRVTLINAVTSPNMHTLQSSRIHARGLARARGITPTDAMNIRGRFPGIVNTLAISFLSRALCAFARERR